MIEAQDHSLFTPLVRGYTQWSLRGHLGGVKIQIEQPDLEPVATLFHATHVSWWDGFLGVCVAQHLGLNFRVAMLEEQLRKYAFLRYAGGFGFTPSDTGSVREMLRYAKQELLGPDQARSDQARPDQARSDQAQIEKARAKNSGINFFRADTSQTENSSPSLSKAIHTPTGLFIFPSARIVPANLRPIPYQPGTASLAIASAKDAAPLRVRAVSWRLEHRGQARPDAFVRVGPARTVTGLETLRELTNHLRQDLTLEADQLESDITLEHLDGYLSAMRGLPSAQEGWDAVRAAFRGGSRDSSHSRSQGASRASESAEPNT
jgi:hypothetical protein